MSAVEEAAARVPGRLEELAQIGRTGEGGVTRLPFTGDEGRAVALFAGWARDAGATVVRDEFGNVFALLGDWERAPGIMAGSHLDSVQNGGRYDGALGVVGALALLESWDRGVPLCAAAFRAEEATQAGRGRIGSSVLAGVMTLDEARATFGSPADDPLPDLPVRAMPLPARYLELHVEQGERLERDGRTIAAVTGITGYARWRARFEGRADHVGTASMDDRRDALAAAADAILAVERIGRDRVDVASVGRLVHEPNRVGVVAAEATLVADLRCWEDGDLDRSLDELAGVADERCRARGVALDAALLNRTPTVRFADDIVAAVTAAGEALGHPAVRLPSGANHDAGTLAPVCPAGMVFVPSRGGRSHTPEEFTSAADCEAGALVLALAARRLADAGSAA